MYALIVYIFCFFGLFLFSLVLNIISYAGGAWGGGTIAA